jgi:hypothetical protein
MIDPDWIERAALVGFEAAVAALDSHGITTDHPQREAALRVAGDVVQAHLLAVVRAAAEARAAPLH